LDLSDGNFFCLFSRTSKLSLRPTQLLVQWKPEFYFPEGGEVKRPGLEAVDLPPSNLRLRIRRAVHPVPLYKTCMWNTLPLRASVFFIYTISDLRLENLPDARKSDTLCKAIASLGTSVLLVRCGVPACHLSCITRCGPRAPTVRLTA
jgi:hypothetical protein